VISFVFFFSYRLMTPPFSLFFLSLFFSRKWKRSGETQLEQSSCTFHPGFFLPPLLGCSRVFAIFFFRFSFSPLPPGEVLFIFFFSVYAKFPASPFLSPRETCIALRMGHFRRRTSLFVSPNLATKLRRQASRLLTSTSIFFPPADSTEQF